jgi:hypothetical protein
MKRSVKPAAEEQSDVCVYSTVFFQHVVKCYYLLVGCPCVATAHNNTHINYPPKRSQGFLLIVSALRIIFLWTHGYHRQQIRDPIPHLPHFQSFIEQEGKGRGEHTCSLPEKDTTKIWASGGDIGNIPLDTYKERARKRGKKPNRSSSKPRRTRTRRRSEKGERMWVSSQP